MTHIVWTLIVLFGGHDYYVEVEGIDSKTACEDAGAYVVEEADRRFNAAAFYACIPSTIEE